MSLTSKGIVSIVVSHRPRPLVAWNVLICDKHDEFDPITLTEKYPLTWLRDRVYECSFPVPRGEARIEVRVLGKSVMVSNIGKGWTVYCQIGKHHG